MAAAADTDTQVLQAVQDAEGGISTLQLAGTLGLTHQEVVGLAKSLGSDDYLVTTPDSTTSLTLTPAGKAALAEGSPEALVFAAVPEGAGATIPDVQAAVGAAVYKAGFGSAMRVKWLRKEGANLVRAVDSITDAVQGMLQSHAAGEALSDKQVKELKKRKMLKEECVRCSPCRAPSCRCGIGFLHYPLPPGPTPAERPSSTS